MLTMTFLIQPGTEVEVPATPGVNKYTLSLNKDGQEVWISTSRSRLMERGFLLRTRDCPLSFQCPGKVYLWTSGSTLETVGVSAIVEPVGGTAALPTLTRAMIKEKKK